MNAREGEDILAATMSKIALLQGLYEKEKNKNDKLSSKVETLNKEIEQKNGEIKALKDRNDKLEIAVSFKSLGGAQAAKKRINELVREIDNCMALLNR
jgi:outer membrane murein-binding lipoprotein Lpp